VDSSEQSSRSFRRQHMAEPKPLDSTLREDTPRSLPLPLPRRREGRSFQGVHGGVRSQLEWRSAYLSLTRQGSESRASALGVRLTSRPCVPNAPQNSVSSPWRKLLASVARANECWRKGCPLVVLDEVAARRAPQGDRAGLHASSRPFAHARSVAGRSMAAPTRSTSPFATNRCISSGLARVTA
jgi:hypothetical protein